MKRFNRIRKDIVAPADKKLLVHFKDQNGNIMRTYHLQDRHININNLFVTEEDQYSSGADIELDIMPTTSIEIEWLNNPSRSRSERKNFFRYLVKSECYELEEFQVYDANRSFEEHDGFDPETDPGEGGSFKHSKAKSGIWLQILNMKDKAGAF